jgi:indole-3-glycerol phosphate synthase
VEVIMVLAELLETTRQHVAQRKAAVPLNSFRIPMFAPKREFCAALRKHPHSLIAEYKRSSPSEGSMGSALSVFEAVDLYGRFARAMSVLTEEEHFGGHIDDLRYVAEHSCIPVLRKDFIIDPYQVYESRYYGADAILLIADILSHDELMELSIIAQELSMDVLIEAHSEESLKKALQVGPQIIGINNRDLSTLAVDRETTRRLAPLVPREIVVVSESGYLEPSHVEEMMPFARAFLIGTAIMKADNPEKKLKDFATLLHRDRERS